MDTQQHIIPKNSFLSIYFFVLLYLSISAIGWSASVDAKLSSNVTSIEQPVEYTITVSGASRFQLSESPEVDGLEFEHAGRQQSLQIHNGQSYASITHRYIIRPLKEGEFTIPSVSIEIGQQVYRTPALKLSVKKASELPPDPSRPNLDSLARMELLVPQTSAYVGEPVPIEVRAYIRRDIRFQIQGMPKLNEDGFITKNQPDPQIQEQIIDGVPYQVLLLKTAISPIKSGSLTLGPAEMETIMAIPQRRQRSRSPFDDIFDSSFFSSAQRERILLKSQEVPMEIKPLPTQGQPANFTGAVGTYMMHTETNATEGRVGDPVTVQIQITGQGDFERITAPQLETSEGWRIYPPTSEFNPDDDLGISGEKIFQVVLIPERPTKMIPSFEFSYFDPNTDSYQTLQSAPIPIEITGAPISTPTPPPAPTHTASQEASDTASPSPAPQDSHLHTLNPIKLHLTQPASSWLPTPGSKNFWILTTSGALTLLALLAIGALKQYSARSDVQFKKQKSSRIASLKQQFAKTNDPEQLYSLAWEILQASYLQPEDPTHQSLDETTLKQRVLHQNRQAEDFEKFTHLIAEGKYASVHAAPTNLKGSLDALLKKLS